ncbi:hypothetical protein EFY79_04115 [Hanamia caeni]|uniref:Uncharacterized protein n=1 Tax=Hanamia caeni TaxID=2294116 RepID=A0A3M9NMX6_9BACT|nr:hypothetical protein [Hanamia caeni]RNI38855.1 hypothetical protein EFY79_04115 [Hanamia caeni]
MKKILSILLLIFFSNIFKVNAQIDKPDSPISAQHKMGHLLLKTSHNQKTAAWILLGAGAGVAIAGAIIGTNAVKNADPDEPFDIFPRGSLTGGGMVLGGAAAMVTSVPFFIASGKNKKKAKLFVQNDWQTFLRRLKKGNAYSVGISLKL